MSACESGDKGCRCDCGALVGRLTPEGVEIKCRRCKRVVLVKLESGATGR